MAVNPVITFFIQKLEVIIRTAGSERTGLIFDNKKLLITLISN